VDKEKKARRTEVFEMATRNGNPKPKSIEGALLSLIGSKNRYQK